VFVNGPFVQPQLFGPRPIQQVESEALLIQPVPEEHPFAVVGVFVVGRFVGDRDGVDVFGRFEGVELGLAVEGCLVLGLFDGVELGLAVGCLVGVLDGLEVTGLFDGVKLGFAVDGEIDGLLVLGAVEGASTLVGAGVRGERLG
jgi:hypothetical protein